MFSVVKVSTLSEVFLAFIYIYIVNPIDIIGTYLGFLGQLGKHKINPICAELPEVASPILVKGACTIVNFARDIALSLHILQNKNYLFSLLNVQASVKSRAKLCQCKCTLMY
jgi:hypothetical protein